MRTTVTLDPDVAALISKLMRERGLTFKQALNDAIRAGVGNPGDKRPFKTPTYAMGFNPEIPWDQALRLAAELEDDELVRKLATRK